jgi:hypothetical protein
LDEGERERRRGKETGGGWELERALLDEGEQERRRGKKLGGGRRRWWEGGQRDKVPHFYFSF